MQHVYRQWMHWGLISALQHTIVRLHKNYTLGFPQKHSVKTNKCNNKFKNWQVTTVWIYLCLKVLYPTLHRFIKTQTYSGLELSDMPKCDSSWRKTQIIGTSIMTACNNIFSALVWIKVHYWAFHYTLYTFPSIGELIKDLNRFVLYSPHFIQVTYMKVIQGKWMPHRIVANTKGNWKHRTYISLNISYCNKHFKTTGFSYTQ